MPTTINEQNIKQIREPMLLHIQLDAYDSDKTPTVLASAYKVADFQSIGETYPFRQLADLQQNGFPLDGSCALYDSTIRASAANGKLGVRGNTNAILYVTLTSNVALEAITLATTGVSAIRYGDDRYDATSDSATVVLGGVKSAELALSPRYANGRACVDTVISGFSLSFDNNNIIDINMTLRADLSPIDPSLPESEIEVHAYYPEDISQMLASVRDDKPIMYSAGYDGDMSTERRFYLSEPATWNNKTVTIKGVDRVGFLDKETFPLVIGSAAETTRYGEYPATTRGAFHKLYVAMLDQLWMSGIELQSYEQPPASTIDTAVFGTRQNSLIQRQSQRDALANWMNLMHWDFGANDFNGLTSFWPTYVDAGIPTARWQKPSVKWDIYEEDCGDIQRRTDRKIAKLTIPTGDVSSLGFRTVQTDGGGTLFKGSGGVVTYGDLTTIQIWWFDADEQHVRSVFSSDDDDYLDLPIDAQWGRHPHLTSADTYGRALYDSQITDNKLLNIQISPFNLVSFPWSTTLANQWQQLVSNGSLNSDDTAAQLSTTGRGYIVQDTFTTYNNAVIGIDEVANKTNWLGVMYAGSRSGQVELLPKRGVESVLARSNETGSFTWKGDPRMQPRDFFNFHRLDGTVEVCTIESIALKHEKGGTTAEIAYRKGTV